MSNNRRTVFVLVPVEIELVTYRGETTESIGSIKMPTEAAVRIAVDEGFVYESSGAARHDIRSIK